MNAKQEGSVTVFLCLALPMLAILLLVLVEGARYYGLKEDAKEWTNLATESLFAEYQPFLLKEYDMFFLDGNLGSANWNLKGAENRMQALLYDNLMARKSDEGIDVYKMNTTQVEISQYRLATDADGKVFEMQAAQSMKDVLGQRAAKELLESIKKVQDAGEQGGDPEQSITDASSTLEEMAKQSAESVKTQAAKGNQIGNRTPADRMPSSPTVKVENPLEIVKALKKQGILTLVLPGGQTVSGNTVNLQNSLLKRKCRKGNYPQTSKPGWYERILMQEFVKPMVGNFLTPKKDGPLSYGAEYIVCGKESDKENLEGTVKKLLLLRETLNFAYLQSDAAKQSEAAAVATAIAGVSGNPALITLVKQGILAAWAYGESILDVKALLTGGKIPLMKTAATWKSGLSNLAKTVLLDYKGETTGISYETYLDVLLYQQHVKEFAYRSMDYMEWDMRNEQAYAKCRMDHMIVGIKAQITQESNPLFFEGVGSNSLGTFIFQNKAEYVYQ